MFSEKPALQKTMANHNKQHDLEMGSAEANDEEANQQGDEGGAR